MDDIIAGSFVIGMGIIGVIVFILACIGDTNKMTGAGLSGAGDGEVEYL